jgi:hypothetical protein
MVTPASAALAYKSTQSYQAAVFGVVNKGVTWKVEPATGGGTVDGNGLYTAPPAQGTYTIVATSVADPTKSGGGARPHHPASGRLRGRARKRADAHRAHAVVSPPGSRSAVSFSLLFLLTASRMRAFAKADTLWIAAFPLFLWEERHNIVPWRSHPPTRWTAWRPRRRSDAGIPWNSFVSSVAKKSPRGSCDGPSRNGKNRRRSPIFFWPNRAISTKVSAPASTASSTLTVSHAVIPPNDPAPRGT